jgi:hypothetical protein
VDADRLPFGAHFEHDAIAKINFELHLGAYGREVPGQNKSSMDGHVAREASAAAALPVRILPQKEHGSSQTITLVHASLCRDRQEFLDLSISENNEYEVSGLQKTCRILA